MAFISSFRRVLGGSSSALQSQFVSIRHNSTLTSPKLFISGKFQIKPITLLISFCSFMFARQASFHFVVVLNTFFKPKLACWVKGRSLFFLPNFGFFFFEIWVWVFLRFVKLVYDLYPDNANLNNWVFLSCRLCVWSMNY